MVVALVSSSATNLAAAAGLLAGLTLLDFAFCVALPLPRAKTGRLKTFSLIRKLYAVWQRTRWISFARRHSFVVCSVEQCFDLVRSKHCPS